MIVSDRVGKDVGGGTHGLEVLRKGMKTHPAVNVFKLYYSPLSASLAHPTSLVLTAELLLPAVKIWLGTLAKEELLCSS
jgi:hypothetical protein